MNTASRLQGVTKELGRGIIMAQSTLAQVSDWVQAEPIGEVRVKGKQESLPIYCPLKVVEPMDRAGATAQRGEQP